MYDKKTVIDDFAKAVEPQISELHSIAHQMGREAVAIKSADPAIDNWTLPQAEIAHVINNVLTFLSLTDLGEFEMPAKKIGEYIERLKPIENQVGIETKPSALFADIKTKIDDTLAAHPGMFQPRCPGP